MKDSCCKPFAVG